MRGPGPALLDTRRRALPRRLRRHAADGPPPGPSGGPARRPCERSQPLLLVRVGARPRDGRRPLPETQAPRARGPLAARLGRDRAEPHPVPGVRSLPEPGREPHRRVPGMGAGVPGQQPAPVLLRPRGGCAVGDGEYADLALQPVGPPHGRARVPRRAARPAARQRGERRGRARPGRGTRSLRRAGGPPPRRGAVRHRHRPRGSQRAERRLRARPARGRRRRGPRPRRRQRPPPRRHGAAPRGHPRPAEDPDQHQPAAGRRVRQRLPPDPAPGAAAGPDHALVSAAVHTIDEMFRLQQDVLPPMEW